MKRIASKGSAVFLALLFVTFLAACNWEWLNPDGAETTDVVYEVSPDGKSSSLTLYFDGNGVPVTAQQRAMNLGLAKMYHEYFEVVFQYGTHVARASWEVGQSAGITGVYRTDAGVDYKFDNSAAGYATTQQGALLFTGTQDGTLLAVGRIVKVDGGAYIPEGDPVYITTDTKSVTFELEAVETCLTDFYRGTATCFFWMNEKPDPKDSKLHPDTLTRNSRRVTFNGKDYYPMYAYTDGEYYRYAIYGGVSSYYNGIKYRDVAYDIVKQRVPRYMQDGQYYSPKANINFGSKIKINTAAGFFDGVNFKNDGPLVPIPCDWINMYNVPLKFEQNGYTGIFSFCIDIPVYLMSRADAENYGPAAKTWYIRTGIGPDLYNLDDAEYDGGYKGGTGGCVFMVSFDVFTWVKDYNAIQLNNPDNPFSTPEQYRPKWKWPEE